MSQIKFARRIRVAAVTLLILAITFGVPPNRRQAHGAASPSMTFTVTNLDDSGDGSLRQAILDANANPGADTIDFQDELLGTITLTSGELDITDDLTINGPGIFAITVSGNHASRVFEINNGVTAMISGLTISDGSTTDKGGGILNQDTLTLTNVVLSGNSAAVAGGAIFNDAESSAKITNSTLSNNFVIIGPGGGIFNGGSTLVITNSTLSGNSAKGSGGGGGGIFGGGSLTIINSTLSGNSSRGGGAGIAVEQGTANISFTTLAGNSSSVSTGGIFVFLFGTVNIKNSIVANNTGGDCSNFGSWNASGVNFTTNGTCPGFTQVTSAQLNLGPLQDNGGPTQTHALLPGSVAIDAAPDCTDVNGSPDHQNAVTPKAVISQDQRGISRPQGSACDVGSYEREVCTAQPTVSCPESFSVSTDPNKCSAVVNFTPATADCPCVSGGTARPSPKQGETCTVSCSPPPGSTFPKGTTTVTCVASDSFGNTSEPCSFTITVNDMQPPTLSCSDVTGVAAASCPIATAASSSFAVTASDNCDGSVTPGCVPSSGSVFPVGSTTVTCTATDSSGNTATCSFTVNSFSFCLQDETNPGSVVLVNAQTGDFSFCCGGSIIASGRGTLTTRGCIGRIDGTKGDRQVHIQWDTSANNSLGAGTAYVQKLSNKIVCQITDRNLSNNSCQCGIGPPSGSPKNPPKNTRY
jgi:hypothetical protein